MAEANVYLPSAGARLRALSGACAALTFALGCMVLAGWETHTPWLRSVLPRFVAMRPLTAAAFVLGGIALALLLAGGRARTAGRIVGSLLVLDGLGALLEYALGTDFHFDRLVFGSDVVELGDGLYPGRLSLDAAVGLVLLGVAFAISRPRGKLVLRDLLAVVACTIAGVVALGYAYGATRLYGVAPFAMAPNTAIGFILLATGLLLEDPRRGLLRMLAHGTVGGVMARRLLPLTTLLPFAVGLVVAVIGPRLDTYGVRLGAAMLVGALIVTFTVVILWNASGLERMDLQRRLANESLRRSEAVLRAERSRLATILERAAHGIVFIDSSGEHLEANPAAEAIVGMPVSGRTLDDLSVDLCDPGGRPLQHDEWPGVRALRGESVSGFELVVARADGTSLPVAVSATPVRDAGGAVTGAVLMLQDITVYKELDRLRDEFASIVAHDLRNPISAILMNVEVILREAEGRPTVEVSTSVLERIHRAGARLGDMVKDLIDASRIEVERLPLDRKRVRSTEAVEAIVEQVRPTLGEHPVHLATEGEPAPILVDAVRFDQILTNLLENAAKYSPKAAPIDVKVAPSDGGVDVSVSDEGMGIAPEDIPLLFDRFYQSKRAREMKTGLGLGLYIVRGLVEAHGGRIWVDSRLEHGSTFHVWLPSAPAQPQHPSP